MSEPARQRRRTPLSCLNCRRRKVKCDKQKPSCGGCIRNGVSHLCQYLQPHWSENSAPDPSSIESHLETVQLRQQNQNHERIIAFQRKEIEELKRQLSFNNQLSTDHRDPNDKTSDSPVKVLVRLNPLLESSREPLEVQEGHIYCINVSDAKNQPSRPKNARDIYSWISIIMLDPKLLHLWHRINHMQKVYYMYKRLMKQKIQLKITEIDFTSPGPGSSGGNAHKCPVVLCDLNFMDSSIITMPAAQISAKVDKVEANPAIQTRTSMARYLQNLWGMVLYTLRGDNQMNATQLNFLLDYYFNDASAETSRRLVSLYKEDIFNFYREVDGRLSMDSNLHGIDQDVSPAVQDSMFSKCVYCSLLVMVIDESLDMLKLNFLNLQPGVRAKFESLFPHEVSFIGLPYSGNHRNNLIEQFLDFSCTQKTFYSRSLSLVAVTVMLLNRDICNIGREGNDRNEASRSTVFRLLLELLFRDTDPVLIWKSPNHIVFANSDLKKRVKDVRIHACVLWNEFIRILNVISFSLVSTVRDDKDTQRLIQLAWARIEQVQVDGTHLKYLLSLKTTQLDRLSTCLKINYLLVNVNIFLNRGVSNLLGGKLTIKDLDDLVGECGSWLEDDRLNRLPLMSELELKIILNVCNIYTTYVMFLQFEENKVENLKENLITAIFLKLDSFFKLANGIIDRLTFGESQYLYNALSEVFVLVIQILLAVLLRVCLRSREKNEDLVKQLSTFYYSMSKSLLQTENNIYNLIRNHLSNTINSTLKKLNACVATNKNHTLKLLKLWNFYLNIFECSKKFDTSYTKAHVNVTGLNKLMNSNSLVMDFDKCPISHSSPGKCPVDHSPSDSLLSKSPFFKSPLLVLSQNTPGKCPVSHNPSSNGKCPVSHNTGANSGKCPVSHSTSSSGKCPVSHAGQDNYPEETPEEASQGCPIAHINNLLSQSNLPMDMKRTRSETFSRAEKRPKIEAPSKEPEDVDFIDRVTKSYLDDELVATGGMKIDFNMKFPDFDLEFLSDPSLFNAFGSSEPPF